MEYIHGKTALITGASSGIGREFARIHAEKGGNLIIVARREEKLKELKTELESKHNVKVHVMARDLASAESAQDLYNDIKSKGWKIDYLINNAGFGGQGYFHEREWERDLAMINLNVVALTALTRFFLPEFVERNEGRILNVSSTASLMPGPLQAVYYATKAYVTSLSNALASELESTNVTVTALLPGPVATEFKEQAGLEKTNLFNRAFPPREVAERGYEAMLAGELNVIAGASFGIRALSVLLPFLPTRLVMSQIRRIQSVKS